MTNFLRCVIQLPHTLSDSEAERYVYDHLYAEYGVEDLDDVQWEITKQYPSDTPIDIADQYDAQMRDEPNSTFLIITNK